MVHQLLLKLFLPCLVKCAFEINDIISAGEATISYVADFKNLHKLC